MGLAGEAGEVLEKLKKVVRNNYGILTGPDIEAIKKELGDVQWYIAVLADELGLTLEEIVQCNIDKLTDRQNRGVIKSEGDNR